MYSNKQCAAAVSALQHIDRWLSYGDLSSDRRGKLVDISNLIERGRTVTDTGYGFYVHGKPELSRDGYRGQWYRVDTWIPYAGDLMDNNRFNVCNPNRFAAAGPEDDSEVFRSEGKTKNGKYNGKKCACCFLGHGHTLDHHNELIANYDSLKSKYSL
jgi:hypothetical protein